MATFVDVEKVDGMPVHVNLELIEYMEEQPDKIVVHFHHDDEVKVKKDAKNKLLKAAIKTQAPPTP